MKIFFKLISIFLISISSVIANEVIVFEFTEAELSELTVRKVRGAKNETNILLVRMKMEISLRLLPIMQHLVLVKKLKLI